MKLFGLKFWGYTGKIKYTCIILNILEKQNTVQGKGDFFFLQIFQ